MNDPNNPIETLVVTFFDHPCLTARLDDGTIALSIRDLCAAVGLRLSSQLRRLRADPDLHEGLVRLRISTAGGIQDQDFLILEFVAAWVSTVDRSRAAAVVQERLRYLRIFSIRHVNDAIALRLASPKGQAATSKTCATSRATTRRFAASPSASKRWSRARTKPAKLGALTSSASARWKRRSPRHPCSRASSAARSTNWCSSGRRPAPSASA